MKLILGLGNPGKIYQHSRHNIGFSVVKEIAESHKAKLRKEAGILAYSAKVRIAGENLILAMPLTFMNLSGGAAKALARKYKIDLENLLVACDDLDLEFGRLKIRSNGSSGGHRGLESISESLGSNAFCRLRIGIGRPQGNLDAAEYVLDNFSKTEKAKLARIFEEAAGCCRSWVTRGIAETMNIFNTRPPILSDESGFALRRRKDNE